MRKRREFGREKKKRWNKKQKETKKINLLEIQRNKASSKVERFKLEKKKAKEREGKPIER